MADRAPRVLIADDDPGVCDILNRFLREGGFEVSTASDGELALAAIETFAPDIVLLDLRMPNMDGLENPPPPGAAYGSTLARYLPREREGHLSGQALRSHVCE